MNKNVSIGERLCKQKRKPMKIKQWEKIIVVILKADQHADFLWYLVTS